MGIAVNLEALSPVPWTNLYHLGMVVPDAARAAEEIGRQLGVAFGTPRPVTVTVNEGGRIAAQTVVVAFCKEGPPYIELIQGAGNGIWSAEGGPRLHHAGIWVDDLAGEVARLERDGMRLEASGADGDGRLSLFAYMSNAFGLRVELVDSRGRDGFIERITG